MNTIPNKAGNNTHLSSMTAATGGAALAAGGEKSVNSIPTGTLISNNHPGNQGWQQVHHGANTDPSIPVKRSLPYSS